MCVYVFMYVCVVYVIIWKRKFKEAEKIKDAGKINLK